MPELDDFLAPPEEEAPEDDAVVDEPEAALDENADDAENAAESAAVEERLWAGKYKTPEEMEKAYLHANDLISKGAHKQPQPEPEPEVEGPHYTFPLGGEPLTPQELEAWATENPQQAAMWVMAPEQDGRVPAEMKNAVIRHWAQNDPMGYSDWRIQQHLETYEQRMAQALAPQQQFYAQQQQQAFLSSLQTHVKGWDDIGTEVLSLIRENPHAIPAQLWSQGMDAVSKYIDRFYGGALRYERYEKERAALEAQQGEAPEAKPARAQRAVTESAGGASAQRAAGGAPSEQDVIDSIIAGSKEAARGRFS